MKTQTARDHAAVTPSDSTLLNAEGGFRYLYIGTTGHVAVVSINNVTAIYKNVPSGTVLPVSGKKVLSTGTTASDIVALF